MEAGGIDEEYLRQIDGACRHLCALIFTKQCAPIMLRLAWHDAGTYDAKTRTGGPNGSIRNEEELNHEANRGLKIAVELCEEVKSKYPRITYADLYQLAGVVAIEISGGPTIDFVPGRKDLNESPEEGRLPDAKQGASHLRAVFYRMGLSDKDIVALSGGHTLGRARPERSGFSGAWTKDPFKFDNSYFVELLEGDTEGLLKLPTDKALVQDPVFRRYAELYAKDEEVFFRDYAESHKKLSELGYGLACRRSSVADKNRVTFTRSALGVVVAVTFFTLGYLYDSHIRSRHLLLSGK
ncbi:putative L-ascorbate peroxidase 3, peroxisomal [Drosera capensis]